MDPQGILSLTREGLFVFSGAMVPLMLWLLGAWWRSGARLAVERRALASLKAKVEQSQKASAEAGGLEGAEALKAIEGTGKATLVYRVAESLNNLKGLAAPDVNAVMELLVAREATPLSGVRNIPNLLMLAGLLGTVWGLAQTVGSLGPAVQGSLNASNPEQLARALGDTLTGMKGAFGCSLAGIALSGLSSLALGLATRQSDGFADDLRDVMLTRFVPAVFPVSSESQFEAQAKQMKDSRRFVKSLQATMEAADHTMQEMGASMSAAAKQIHDVSEDLGERLGRGADALADAQVKFASSFEANTTRLTERLDVQLTKLVEVQGYLAGVSGSLDRTAKMFEEGGNNQVQASRDVQSSVKASFDDLVGALVKEFGGHAATLAGLNTALTTLSDQQASLPVEFSNVVAAATGQQASFVAQVRELLTGAGSAQKDTATVLERVSDTLEKVQGASNSLSRTMVEDREGFTRSLEAARENLTRALEAGQDRLAKALGVNFGLAAEQWRAAAADQKAAVATLTGFARDLSEQRADTRGALDGFGKTMEAAQAGVALALAENLSGTGAALGALQAEVSTARGALDGIGKTMEAAQAGVAKALAEGSSTTGAALGTLRIEVSASRQDAERARLAAGEAQEARRANLTREILAGVAESGAGVAAGVKEGSRAVLDGLDDLRTGLNALREAAELKGVAGGATPVANDPAPVMGDLTPNALVGNSTAGEAARDATPYKMNWNATQNVVTAANANAAAAPAPSSAGQAVPAGPPNVIFGRPGAGVERPGAGGASEPSVILDAASPGTD